MSNKCKATLSSFAELRNAPIATDAEISFSLQSITKKQVILQELREAHEQLKLRLEAKVLAYHLAQEYGATDPAKVERMAWERRKEGLTTVPQLCALNQIKADFMEELHELKSLAGTINTFKQARVRRN